jgi:DNA-binding NarL/FixJ family response regulator
MAGTLDGVSVLAVADTSIYRHWITAGLRDCGAVVHACGSSTGELDDWTGRSPLHAIDVAVVDLDARCGRGVEIALALREHRPRDWPWIALAHGDDAVQRAAVRVGRAASLLMDVDAPEVLTIAIADALRAPCSSTARARQLAYARQMFSLNDDEVACVAGVLDQKTNAAIARALGCSVSHIARTMSDVQEKLGVTRREGIAARIAAMSELVEESATPPAAISRSLWTDRSIDRYAAIK